MNGHRYVQCDSCRVRLTVPPNAAHMLAPLAQRYGWSLAWPYCDTTPGRATPTRDTCPVCLRAGRASRYAQRAPVPAPVPGPCPIDRASIPRGTRAHP
jgi:hypothetical protein